MPTPEEIERSWQALRDQHSAPKSTGPHYIDLSGNLIENSAVRRSAPDLLLTPSELAEIKEIYSESKRTIFGLKDAYKDQPVHVFGTGPSLKDHALKVDWSSELTIGVNGAPMSIPNLKFWIMSDDFVNPTCCPPALAEWVRQWLTVKANRPHCLVRKGIVRQLAACRELLPLTMFNVCRSPDDSGDLFVGRSTVHAGLELARFMGCNPIYLWGVDYTDVHTHAYDAKFDNPVRSDNFTVVMTQFLKIKDILRGTEVFNCNPNSRLDVFPKVDPASVIPISAPSPRESSPNDHELKIDFASSCISYLVNGEMTVWPFDRFPANSHKAIENVVKKCKALFEESKIS